MRVVVFRVGLASLLAVASVDWALAQVTLPEVAVTGRRPNEERPVRRSREAVPARAQPRPTAQPSPADTPSGAQPAATPWGGPPGNAASEKVFSGATVNAYPALRPGEVLETVPGLIVTQHSGEGKANQYFLRGFNLDHGTDLAIWVDGMPVNMRTHGHGQGYADISFLIPELIRSMTVRKGPYFAEEGDFSSAGAVHIDYVDRLDKNLLPGHGRQVRLRRGPGRGLDADPAGQSWRVRCSSRAKAPSTTARGTCPTEMRKFNGVVRYSQGTLDDGFSITGMAYDNRWTSTDQVAARAIDLGHRSAASARSIRPTAAARAATACPDAGAQSDDGRRHARRGLRHPLARSRCSTTSPISSTIRSTATSSARPTGAPSSAFNANHTLQGPARRFDSGDHGRRRRAATTTSRSAWPRRLQRNDAVHGARRCRAGGQRRRLRPEHHPLDQMAAHHRRAARRLVRRARSQRQAAEFRQRRRLHRQPEVQPDLRPVRQDRDLPQCRARLSHQRRARRP